MNVENIDQLFNSFKEKNVLIIGDAMIDSYMWGRVERMSPEAPVPVVEVDKYEDRLGGAANVARNISELGALPILFTVIGDDNRGKLFLDLMKKNNLPQNGILISGTRKTTIKTRIIAQEKHQLRVDEEETSPIDNEEELISLIQQNIEDAHVVILQDYNKGVLTPKIIHHVIQQANNNNIPTIIDPKKDNFNTYNECTLFKPNFQEIQQGLNIEINKDNEQELRDAAELVRKQLNAKSILITLSDKGICMKTHNDFYYIPAFKRNIIDVSGAGDTVLSLASLLSSCSINDYDISKISSLAGGLVCEEIGVVPINKNKLLEEMKIIYT